LPAFAFSLLSRQPDNLPDRGMVSRASWSRRMPQLDLPPRTVLNVNVPNLPLDHIRGMCS
jgi:5'-nucleotidase